MKDWKLQPARDLGLPAEQRWRSLHRENGLLETITQGFWRVLTRGYLCTYHRLSVSGREYLPAAPPMVLIANHASHLDALCLAASLPSALRERVLPVAAGDTFFETPTQAAFSAFLLNALPMWRKNCGRHALDELRRRLIDEPCGYILFPEGTRSRDGEMLPFKAGLGMLVAGTAVPVVPCRIDGAFDACPPHARVPRPKRIQVRIGPHLEFADLPQNRDGWEVVRARCEEAVRALAAQSTLIAQPTPQETKRRGT
ncbi:MAG: 1-acyl-sn-glycerol-3-phosphate acyltransferase [Planctomycetes bacterium]|nr:1-acyl-sn-glycerol-3-phosphate acyltransferase [Planctomycetota bacterium]